MPLRKVSATLEPAAPETVVKTVDSTTVVGDAAFVARVLPAMETKAAEVKESPKVNAEWEAQERRRQRGNRWDAAIMSHALMQYAPGIDAYLDLVRKAADAGTVYANE